MSLLLKYVLATLAIIITFTQAAFYDCNANLGVLRSDTDSLALVKQAHKDKFKFSSQCLELVLKKNFF